MPKRSPDFVCIGSQKCGTTSLYDLLADDPRFRMPTKKEQHFFNRPLSDPGKLDDYLKSFDSIPGELLTGDITPDYILFPDIAATVRRALPDAKIVVVIRHPVARAYSQWLHHKIAKVEPRPDFARAMEEESTERSVERLRSWSDPPMYLYRGLYGEQLRSWFREFDGKVHVAVFEELFKQKDKQAWASLFAFLGLEQTNAPQIPTSNTSREPSGLYRWLAKRFWLKKAIFRVVPFEMRERLVSSVKQGLTQAPEPLSPVLRAKLFEEFFADDVRLLEELTGRSFDLWRGFPSPS